MDATAIPERAGREGDQPLPKAGKRDVLADLAATMPGALAARRAIGIRRYGRPLETWNGRDVHQDLDDELADALAYARQAKFERQDLERELVALRDRNDALATENEDLREEIRNLTGTKEALDARIDRIRCHVPEDIRRDAEDVEHAVELLSTAYGDASAASFKCCPRNAWGDGEHDASCAYRAKLEELAAAKEAIAVEVAARKHLEERLGAGG